MMMVTMFEDVRLVKCVGENFSGNTKIYNGKDNFLTFLSNWAPSDENTAVDGSNYPG